MLVLGHKNCVRKTTLSRAAPSRDVENLFEITDVPQQDDAQLCSFQLFCDILAGVSFGLLLKDPVGRGGGVVWGPGQPRPTYPPIHIRKIFLRGKLKFITGAGKLEADFRYTNCFFCL